MKRVFFIIIFLLSFIVFNTHSVMAGDISVYSDNGKFGLKTESDEIVVKAVYKKLIRIGQSSWLVQNKRNKFGLIDNSGNVLIKPKYSHAERLFEKYIKLGNDKDYGLYDEYGKTIIPPEFSSIEPLLGGKFVTCNKYKYGLYSIDGKLLLHNKYDFIHTTSPKTIRLSYQGNVYEIENVTNDKNKNDNNADILKYNEQEFKITKLGKASDLNIGRSLLKTTNYPIKVFSTISTAYEDTIDELMFSQGAETISIFMKLSWLPKFPVVYAKKYYSNMLDTRKNPIQK